MRGCLPPSRASDESQRDVAVPPAPARGPVQGLGQAEPGGAGRGGARASSTTPSASARSTPAGDAPVLLGEPRPQVRALLLGRGGQRLAVQDADGRLGPHDRDLRVRPREDRGGAEGA